MERNFDLKDALRGGMTPEEMLADFQRQLAEAQTEVANERAAAVSELDEAREDMVDAIIDYTVALGITPPDVAEDDEFRDGLVETIKETEQEMAAMRPLLNMLRDMKKAENKERTPDDVIGEFLKSLR